MTTQHEKGDDEVHIAEMLERGLRFNRGYGDQVALPLDRWQRPDRGEQLCLFAEAAYD